MDTTPAPSPGGLTFLDYLRPVWRFKVIVVLVVVLAAAATYFYENHQTKVYQSSTRLYVGQSTLQELLTPTAAVQSPTTVANQALLLTTPAVADVVRKRLNLTSSPRALLDAIQAVPSSNTSFLTITAKNANPDLAARLANGFAQAYLRVAGGSLVGSARSSLRATEGRLKQLGGGLANSTVRTGLRQQIAALEGIISSPPSVGLQLAPAAVSNVPISPKPTRDAIFAGALALVIGVILSYLFDRGDRRVRRLDELETLFELPVLANVPHVRHPDPTPGDPAGTPASLREPLRTLRVSLDIARAASNGKDVSQKVILVTSALPAEGKSTIVRNLAISYREAGSRVAVLEADLRRPVLAAQFGVEPGPGLSEALAEAGELSLQRVADSAEPPLRHPGAIDVAVAGAGHDDPTVLLTEERLRVIISGLAAEYDIVLVDSPPLLAVSDGLPLLGLADGVLLVVRAGTVTRPAAERVRATIDRVNRVAPVHLLGIVANDVADELAAYYGDSYYGKHDAARPGNRSSGLAAS
jgi:succinoglycan biosynthesis transport protein ExoP